MPLLCEQKSRGYMNAFRELLPVYEVHLPMLRQAIITSAPREARLKATSLPASSKAEMVSSKDITNIQETILMKTHSHTLLQLGIRGRGSSIWCIGWAHSYFRQCVYKCRLQHNAVFSRLDLSYRMFRGKYAKRLRLVVLYAFQDTRSVYR